MSTDPKHSTSKDQGGSEASSTRGAAAGPQSSGSNEESSRLEAMYDRFAERVREISESGQEKGREAIDKTLDLAREQLSAAGEFSAEQGESFKRFLRQDMEQTQRDMRAASQEAKEHLHPARLGAGALSSISRLLEAGGDALQSWSRKAEDSLRFHTGDITTAGTMTCVKCGQTLQLKTTTKIPPCPSCYATDFRKGY